MRRDLLYFLWVSLLCGQDLILRRAAQLPLDLSLPPEYVRGKVVEASTGEPLPGVLVRFGNTGTYTDAKGAFSLPFTQPDTLRLFLSGYREIRSPLSAPSSNLLFRLAPIETELQAVQIIEDAHRETELGIFLERLRSLEIGEVYSQELIMRRSTDFYVPNVLRRLPGVSLLSGRFVSIRGLAERYNVFAFGTAYPTWLTYDASFGELEQLITTLLGRIEVRKFWTPELVGHFGGGMVDFQLPSPTESGLQVAFTSEVDFGAVGRPFARFRPPLRSPLPENFPSPATIQASENAGRPLPENFTYGQQVRRYTVPDTLPWAPPGGLLTLSYNLRQEKWGLTARSTYSQRYLSSQINMVFGNFVNDGDKWYFKKDLQFVNPGPIHASSRSGGITLHSYWLPAPQHLLSFETLWIIGSRQAFSFQESFYINPDISPTQFVFSQYSSFRTSRSHLGIGRFSWEYRQGPWLTKLQTGFTAQGLTLPQAGAMNYVRYPNTTSLVYEHELYGPQEIYSQVWTSTAQAMQLYAHPYAERRWNIPWGWLQVCLGGWASVENQRTRARQLGFQTDTTGGGPHVLNPAVYDISGIQDVYNPAHVRPGGWYLIERTGDFHRHRGSTSLLATYAWLRLAAGDRFEGLAGFRYEAWSRSIYYTPLSTEKETLATQLKDSYWLPSLLLKYRLTEKQSLRLGGSLTLLRPPLPFQVPMPFFDYCYAFFWQGELSAVKTSRSLNLDLRYEWTAARNKILSLTLFYKRLRNLPELYLIPASYTLNFTYTTRSRQWGEVVGVELEARYPLWETEKDRLWSYFTFTLSESGAETPAIQEVGSQEAHHFQGHTPIVANQGLLYDRRRYEIALFANYTSSQIWAIGFDSYIFPHVVEEKRLTAEAQFTYRFSDRWEARIAIWDFINQPYRRTQRFANAEKYDPNRDALMIWERPAYRIYLTVRYRITG